MSKIFSCCCLSFLFSLQRMDQHRMRAHRWSSMERLFFSKASFEFSSLFTVNEFNAPLCTISSRLFTNLWILFQNWKWVHLYWQHPLCYDHYRLPLSPQLCEISQHLFFPLISKMTRIHNLKVKIESTFDFATGSLPKLVNALLNDHWFSWSFSNDVTIVIQGYAYKLYLL